MQSPSTKPNLKFKIQHGRSQYETAKQAVTSESLFDFFFSFETCDKEEELDLGAEGLQSSQFFVLLPN